jgi:hypothetical protein
VVFCGETSHLGILMGVPDLTAGAAVRWTDDKFTFMSELLNAACSVSCCWTYRCRAKFVIHGLSQRSCN